MNNLGNSSFGIKFESDDPNSMLGIASAPRDASHYNAAEAAVAKLESIMVGQRAIPVASAPASLKRKPDAPPSNSMEEDEFNKKKKPLTNERREERNMREKERSLKITQQISELRDLLGLGGVIVPKGTKSTILTEAANYIRLLQQHQYRSEMDKAQLVQEVQRIGNGAIGEKAAYAIRHAATQNGVSAMANLPEGPVQSAEPLQSPTSDPLSDSLGDREYRCVFNSCSVGMAIATMGGSFIDCNRAFTELASYTKQELKAMTIFNITSREDLQGAFDMMSQLITPATGEFNADGNNTEESKPQSPVVLRSAIRHRDDLGLSVSLIRGEDGVARYFNITLVKLPPTSTGSGGLKPVPAMAEMAQAADVQPLHGMQQQHTTMMHMPIQEAENKQNLHGMNSPQYTAG
eukprot:CAMPEP_0172297654 /NCGR_PEP_ID=MMETSP1058-20130122/590_1 /TAXON_ID=83371 /ORGANISM="Detonula confervacea, Strain CCMP 353" /LENGTH=405 /DNA_ID=CAMNT_0013006827 /DNA_START=223 /DNA_END=1440 /DNA_ORIENTATION=-